MEENEQNQKQIHLNSFTSHSLNDVNNLFPTLSQNSFQNSTKEGKKK